MADPVANAAVSPVTIALVSGAISIVVALVAGLISGFGAAWLQRERIRAELKLEFATEALIRDLLADARFPEKKRSFSAIKKRLKGFDDDELRKHLIRAGAVSFQKRREVAGNEAENEVELWGLRDLVEKEQIWQKVD